MIEDLIKEAIRGYTDKDWFLVAGAALSLLVMGARWLLAKKWPSMGESDIKGVIVTALLAGMTALASTWLSNRSADSETLMGALRVWAGAVLVYVTTKKMGVFAKWLSPKADAPSAGN